MAKIIFIAGVLLMIVFPLASTLYHEYINSKQLDQLFGEEDCIEGSLASLEAVWPKIKFSTVSDNSFSKSDKNDSEHVLVKSKEKSKSPLSEITELARFNNVTVHYDVIDEKGPPHNKRFTVKLKLGKEEYEAEGTSIKLAQREAAQLALNSTLLEQAPLKQTKLNKVGKSSVEKLSEWILKRFDKMMIKYYYLEETEYENNLIYYFHSKPQIVHRVIVKVNEKEYSGKGFSPHAAKENAANLALKDLRNLDGLCPFNNNEGGVLAKLFGFDSDNESPVSLINEFGSKSKLETSFSLYSEEGPAHMKHFVFKCRVGDYETFGDGSSKKESKKEAAKKMVQILKTKAFQASENCSKVFKNQKRNKRSKSKNLTKSFKPKPSYIEYDEMNKQMYENIPKNPISKLYEIQQRIKGPEPFFKLIKESDGVDKEFSIQVFVGELSCIGSGHNKKSAKKKAAEEMLKKLGYSFYHDKERLTISDSKKKDFMSAHNYNLLNKQFLDSSIISNSDSEFSNVEKEINSNAAKESFPTKTPKDLTNIENDQNQPKKHSKDYDKVNTVDPIKNLKSVAENLGVKFEFYNFPQDNSKGFVSLLSITTNPPKVCKGASETVERSQERAALSALKYLYKTQLETINNYLMKSRDEKVEEVKEANLEIPEFHVKKEKSAL